jgi:heterodisulfide reductase subunit C
MESSAQQKIGQAAGTRVEDCYQCGKCTAGCPMADRMDIVPNQIVRLVQMGLLDRAMRAQSIWLCVSCQTCSTRCPQSVDCAGVMDALRQLSVEQAAAAPEQKRTVIFQKAFLQNIRRNGRLNEIELIGLFKTWSFLKGPSAAFLMKDSMLAPQLMQRGKFHLIGEKVRDRALVGRIFERCMAKSEAQSEAQ